MSILVLLAIHSFLTGLDATVLTPSLFGYLEVLMGVEPDHDALMDTYGRLYLIQSLTTLVVTPMITEYLVRTGKKGLRGAILLSAFGSACGGFLYTSASCVSGDRVVVMVVSRSLDAAFLSFARAIRSVWVTKFVPNTERAKVETCLVVAFLGGQSVGPGVAGLLNGFQWKLSQTITLTQFNSVGVCIGFAYLLYLFPLYLGFHIPSAPLQVSRVNDGKSHSVVVPILRLLCMTSVMTTFRTIDLWFAPVCVVIFQMNPNEISFLYLAAAGGSVVSILLNILLKRHVRSSFSQTLWSIVLVVFGATLFNVSTYSVTRNTIFLLAVWFGMGIAPLIVENRAQFTIVVSSYTNVARWLTMWEYVLMGSMVCATEIISRGLRSMDHDRVGSSQQLTPLITGSVVVAISIACFASLSIWGGDFWTTIHTTTLAMEEEVGMLTIESGGSDRSNLKNTHNSIPPLKEFSNS